MSHFKGFHSSSAQLQIHDILGLFKLLATAVHSQTLKIAKFNVVMITCCRQLNDNFGK